MECNIAITTKAMISHFGQDIMIIMYSRVFPISGGFYHQLCSKDNVENISISQIVKYITLKE